MADLTFITPTVGRSTLEELAQCIRAQTVPVEWSLLTDTDREGPAALRNRMVRDATTEWVNPIDDDDLLDPEYAGVISQFLTREHDIVYAWCTVEGRWEPDTFQHPADHAVGRLRYENLIPNCAAIRRDLWLEIGGQRDGEFEDWDFWLRARHVGARFHCVEQPMWTVRMGDWQHRTDGEV